MSFLDLNFKCQALEGCSMFAAYGNNTLCKDHFQLTVNPKVNCYGCYQSFSRTRSAYEGRYYCNDCINLLDQYKHLCIGGSTLSNHHINRVQYIKLLVRQDFHCLFCNVKTSLKIDHDHRCCPKVHSCGNCIRGLLCHKHNLLVGYFDNSRELIEQMERYTSQHISLMEL